MSKREKQFDSLKFPQIPIEIGWECTFVFLKGSVCEVVIFSQSQFSLSILLLNGTDVGSGKWFFLFFAFIAFVFQHSTVFKNF